MEKVKRYTSIVITYIFVMSILLQSLPLRTIAVGEAVTTKALQPVGRQIVFKLKNVINENYKKLLEEFEASVVRKDGNRFLVELKSEQVGALLEKLSKDENVEYAEVNALIEKQGLPNDNYKDSQAYLYDSHIVEAWDNITPTTEPINIAVIDSGVQSNHEDLTGKVEAGYNFVSNNTNAEDDNGHGTQVAGIIAAAANNTKGIAGVASKYNVKIIPIKVLDNTGVGTSVNLAAGVDKAVSLGASIINISCIGEGYSKVIEDAIKNALSKNIIVVVTAGGKGDYAENYYPANVAGTIVVADSGSQGNRSNIGRFVTLAANGDGYTTTINNGYVNVSGTSYSTAVVTGIAALAKSKYPNYTKAQIENLLKKSADPREYNGYNHNTGYGVVDALKMTLSTSGYVEIASPGSGEPLSQNFNLRVKALNPDDLKSFDIYINDPSQPLKNVIGNGSKEYTELIDITYLKEGTNKIGIKAYSKTGTAIYEDYRYVKRYNADKSTITIRLKGKDGQWLPKGTLVHLINYNIGFEVNASTDENGYVSFYNTRLGEKYTVLYACNYGTEQLEKIGFFNTEITNTGENIVLDASGSRAVTINAKKADGTPLTKSVLNFHTGSWKFSFYDMFDTNGQATIYVKDDIKAVVNVINTAEGYFYIRNFESFTGINTIDFKVDTAVSKVTVTNDYGTVLLNQNMYIRAVLNGKNYGNIGFSVGSKPLYVTKGSYNINYSIAALNSNQEYRTYNYNEENKIFDADVALKYGKINVKLTALPNLQNSKDAVEFKLDTYDTYNRSVVLDEEDIMDKSDYKLLDADRKEVLGGIFEYRTFDDNSGKSYGIELRETLPSGIYYVKLNKNFGSLGIITSNELQLSYTSPNSQYINTVVKAPFNEDFGASIKVYNKTTKNVLYETSKWVQGQSFSFELNKKLLGADNAILVTGSNYMKGTFVYNRNLPATATTDIVIDGSDTGTIKANKLSFDMSDTDKNSLLKDSSFEVITAYDSINFSGYLIASDGSANVWLDNGSYNFILKNGNANYLLAAKSEITASNKKVTFNTSNLAVVKLLVNNVKNYRSAALSMNGGIFEDEYYMEVKVGENAYLSPELNYKLYGLTIRSFDEETGNNYEYNYEGNLPLNTAGDKNINLSNFTLENLDYNSNVTLPESLHLNYQIMSGGYRLSYIDERSNYDFSNEYKDYLYQYDPIYLELYDENGKIATTSRDNGNHVWYDFAELSLPILASGKYNAKIMLPSDAVQITQAIPVNIEAGNLKVFKVMNPFDTSQPLVHGQVAIFDDYGYVTGQQTDGEGNFYIDCDKVNDASKIIISALQGNETAVYSPNNLNDSVIAISIAELNSVSVKQLSSAGKIDLKYVMFGISKVQDRGIDWVGNLFVDSQAEGKLYLGSGSYNLSCNQERNGIYYILFTEFKAEEISEAVIDNVNFCEINSSEVIDEIYGPGFGFSNFSGTLYTSISSRTTIDYRKESVINDNGETVSYTGFITPETAGPYTIKFDTNFNFSGSLGNAIEYSNDVYSYSANGRVEAYLELKDGFGNRIDAFDAPLKAIISQAGNTTTYECTNNWGSYSFNLSGFSGTGELNFEYDLGRLGKATSETFNISVNTDGFFKVTVKDTQGGLAQKGTVYVFETSNYNPDYSYLIGEYSIANGMAYIPKDRIREDNNYKVSAFGTVGSTDESFVYVRDFNKQDVLYEKSLAMSKVTLKVQSPNGKVIDSVRLGAALNKKEIFYTDFENIENSLNKAVWMENGNYSFRATVYSSDGSIYDLRNNKQLIAADKTIEFSTSNLGQVIPVNNTAVRIIDALNYRDAEQSVHIDFGSRYNRMFIAKGTYEELNIGIRLPDVDGYMFSIYKNNVSVKDDITQIAIEDTTYYMKDYYGENIRLPQTLMQGETKSIDVSSIKDDKGFSIGTYHMDNGNLKMHLLKDGVETILSAEGYRQFTIPQDLPVGMYTVELKAQVEGFGYIKSLPQKVLIADSNTQLVKIEAYFGNRAGNLRICDGEVEVINSRFATATVEKSALQVDKSYTAYVTYQDYNGNIVSYTTQFRYNGDMVVPLSMPVADYKYIKINTLAAAVPVEITSSNGTSVTVNSSTAGDLTGELEPGEYIIRVNAYSSEDNKYYLLNKAFTVTDTTTEIGFTASDISKLQLVNKFNQKPYETNYSFKNANNDIMSINYSVLPSDMVLINIGSYTINAELKYDSHTPIKASNYKLDITNAISQLNIGEKLLPKISLANSSLNINDSLSIGNVEFFEGTASITGFKPTDLTINSYDLMHGSTVIKNFTGGISPLLYGECNIKLNLSSSFMDNLSSDIRTITVNNPSFTAFGDINLDSKVNIYDLVFISKDFGKQKDIASEYDGRCNIDNTDNLNLINIKDLARAARNYNKKF